MGFLDSVTSALGSAIGGIPGMLVGTAANFGAKMLGNQLIAQPNAEDAWKREQASAREAFERSYGAYKRRYQDTVLDLKAAGLNPIMATGQGISVGSSPQMTAARGYLPSEYDINATNSALDVAKTRTEEERRLETIASTTKKWQETKESMARTIKIKEEKKLITEQQKMTMQNIKNAEKEYWRIVAQAKKAFGEGRLVYAMESQVARKTDVLIMEMKKLAKSAGWYKGYFGEFLGYLRAITESLGLNVGIITGLKVGK